MPLRTSETDPLRIADIPVGFGTRRRDTVSRQAWRKRVWQGLGTRPADRYCGDNEAWGATVVVTLIEDQEFAALEVEGLPEAVRDAGMAWHHLPITDVSVPDERFERQWSQVWPMFRARLDAGEKLLVHCRGGLGRAGTVAALMLVEVGGDASNGDQPGPVPRDPARSRPPTKNRG